MFTHINPILKKTFVLAVGLLTVAALLLSGCAPRAASAGMEKADLPEPTVSFTLAATSDGGSMAFIGSGGDLEGVVNPDLVVRPGDVVEIVLVAGSGRNLHRLTLPDFDAASKTIARQGEKTSLVFTADREGEFPYFDSVSGHRYAGLEGRLIVASSALGEASSGEQAVKSGQEAGSSIQETGSSGQPAGTAEQQADVSFTLSTGFDGGSMVFIASGGELDGQTNPDLQVAPGDVVEIILVNGDGVQHNLAFPDLDLLSEDVFKEGEQTRLVFTAPEAGIYAYICAIAGHQQAGMEGRLVVGQPQAVETDAAASIVRPADDLPGPITRNAPEHVRVDLETTEVEGRLADGTTYTYWTFNDLVPGPFIRVRAGDTVEVHLTNRDDSMMMHSVDFHAVTGPGGGAVATQTRPGEGTTFTFKAINPGLYVYHCATPMVAHHITNGMYGLILVEPEGGLPPVDREFYVMQGEIYTAEPMGQAGALTFSQEKLLDEAPEYFVFNGAVGGLTQEHPLQANVGETVRIFFGVGGPNFTSSFHVIGEIFDRVYDQGSLTAPPLTDVQTTIVPTGGAAMVEFTLQVPGRYILVDHSLSRLERGLAGFLVVEGPEAPDIYTGVPVEGSGH